MSRQADSCQSKVTSSGQLTRSSTIAAPHKRQCGDSSAAGRRRQAPGRRQALGRRQAPGRRQTLGRRQRPRWTRRGPPSGWRWTAGRLRARIARPSDGGAVRRQLPLLAGSCLERGVSFSCQQTQPAGIPLNHTHRGRRCTLRRGRAQLCRRRGQPVDGLPVDERGVGHHHAGRVGLLQPGRAAAGHLDGKRGGGSAVRYRCVACQRLHSQPHHGG